VVKARVCDVQANAVLKDFSHRPVGGAANRPVALKNVGMSTPEQNCIGRPE